VSRGIADGISVFLIAGEPSGDALGAHLMAALKERTGGRVRFSGIGGPAMAREGLASLFPMTELSVMGLVEVLPRIPRLLRRIGETVAAIRDIRADAVITIDAPGFCLRVASRLKKSARAGGPDIPIIHYVAPQVWAWRGGRAKKLTGLVDHLLVLLPFEPPYFEKFGLACTFVGHPALESGAGCGDGAGFRARLKLAPGDPVLCLLPGSRAGEVARLLPVYRETVARMVRDVPRLRVVCAVAQAVAARVKSEVATWPVPVHIAEQEARFDAMAASTVALAASGTVTLELAAAGVPMVVAYRMNPVTAWVARRVVHVQYANLVNLVLGRGAIPELLLEDCYPEALAGALLRLLRDEGARKAQQAAMAEALNRLGRGGPRPSLQAAKAVLGVIATRQAREEKRTKD
jgi:lipid-A-disaccharide synthase